MKFKRTNKIHHHYPFGMLMPARTWDAESSYRFGFNGMEKDDEMKGAGNSYTTEFRMLDVRLGRWWSPDPVPKYHESQYAWNTNNPIVFIDINGADSTQRATAVATAEKFVSKNPTQDGSLYGGKGTEPGTSTDCSGLISACSGKAGETLNKAVPNGQRKKDGNQSGVLNIEDNCVEVKLQDVKVGYLYSMHKSSNDSYHIGIISKVNKDENGNIVSLTIIHSEVKKGPVTEEVSMIGENRWTTRTHKILKWDTKPDITVNNSSQMHNNLEKAASLYYQANKLLDLGLEEDDLDFSLYYLSKAYELFQELDSIEQ